MAKKTKAAPAAAVAEGPPPTPRLLEQYKTRILPELSKKFGRTNPMNLPKVQKVVVNMGVGSATVEKKHLEEAVAAMTQITGQKPLVTTSRHSISGFKLRENLPIGCKVTLRGLRMYEFLDRLFSLALPRVRDFRGLPKNAFDGRGNYSLGLSEQLVFPELNPDKYTRPQGMNITICISGSSDEESRELLREMGLPFKTDENTGKKGSAKA
ncbi:MAG: 50S ribosomal protein L5 [Pirellulales bacterium]|nr:50S ribosomal protein L5 [Pirellulales bacterium]